MKILRTLILIAILSFIAYINLAVYGAIKDSWIDKIANHFIAFYSTEGVLLLMITHFKVYSLGKQRLIKKGKNKKDIREALDEIDKDKIDNE